MSPIALSPSVAAGVHQYMSVRIREQPPSAVVQQHQSIAPPILHDRAPADRDIKRCDNHRSTRTSDRRCSCIGGRPRGRRLARALALQDALPTRVPANRWLELFKATLAVT